MQDQQNKEALSSEAIRARPLRDRVGLVLLPNDPADVIVARIREAEQAGVQQIWLGNAGSGDSLTLFAAAFAQTEHIRLGTSIVPIYPRHPLVMALQVLVLHDLAPGRLRLGVGPGGRMTMENWYGLSQTSPLPYLKEYVEVLHSLLWEENTNYQGAFFKVAFSLPRTAPVPLLISALGPKAFQLAGEISDGALSWMCPIPYMLDVALPALQAGAEAHQRPAPPINTHVLVALSADETTTLSAARQWVKWFAGLEAYGRTFARAGFAGAVNGDEAELNALTQTLLISGDEATVRSRMKELLTSGLDELQLQLVPIADEEREREQLLQLIGSL